MRRARRGIAIGLCVALGAAGAFHIQGGGVVGAATTKTTLTCGPSDPAVRKAIQDNASLIGGLTGGLNLNALPLPATIEYSVPAELSPGDDADLSFSWNVELSVGVVDLLTTAGLKTITVDGIDLPVQAVSKGQTIATVNGTRSPVNLTLTKGTPANVTGGPFTGKLEDVGGGLIKYSSSGGGFTVKGDMTGSPLLGTIKSTLPALFPGGGNVLTLAQTCSTGQIASTVVKVPGAPTIGAVPGASVQQGIAASVDVSPYIVPGQIDGQPNPIIPGSLKLTGNTEGFSLNGDTINFAGSTEAGNRTVTFEVCAVEVEEIPAVEAVSEVQTVAMNGDYTFNAGDANPFNNLDKPIYFTLKIDGKETGPIQTTALRKNQLPPELEGLRLVLERPEGLFGPFYPVSRFGTYDHPKGLTAFYGPDGKRLPIPAADLNAITFLAQIWATNTYSPPTAADIQPIIDAAVGAGNVKVTDGPANPDGDFPGWTFTYAGDLADRDVPEIQIGQWVTFPPQDILDALLAIVGGGGGGGGGGEGGGGGGLPPLSSWEEFWGALIKPPAPTGDLIADGLATELYVVAIGALVGVGRGLGETPNAVVQNVLSWFPKKPAVATTLEGAAFEAAKMSGPLCAEGSWTVNVADGAVAPETTIADTDTAVQAATTLPPARQRWAG